MIAIVFLLGFYLVTVLIALALLAVGAGIVVVSVTSDSSPGTGALMILAVTVMPAVLLLYGLVKARPPRFTPPGRELARDEAPALFAMLDELARAAKTRAPAHVYLAAAPNVGVTQRGGVFGVGSTRVLVLGVPMLHLLRASELRAVLAHEFGHFVGSDTVLAGVHGYTHALFLSVLRTTRASGIGNNMWILSIGAEVSAWLGSVIARFYGRAYFRVTHALSRRQELAADALAAEITGTATASSALEATVHADLYEAYLTSDVLDAIACGAVPSDLLRGFDDFRAAVLARDDSRAALERLRREATDPFDTHPSLADRLAALSRNVHEVLPRPDEDVPATSLVATDLTGWLSEQTGKMYSRPQGAAPLKTIPWSEIPSQAFEPHARDNANRIARALSGFFPQAQTLTAMFASLVRALDAGGLAHVAQHLDPGIAYAPYNLRWGRANRVAATALVTLFQGALLERGARAKLAFGAPCLLWRIQEVDVYAAGLAARAFESPTERATICRWAAYLGG